MSAEIENNKEEEPNEPRRPFYLRPIDHWQIVLKFLELIFCIICVSLLYEPLQMTRLVQKQLHHIGIYYTSFTGYMVIILVLLIGRFLKDRLAFKTNLIFSVTGSCLFFLSGVLLIVDRVYISSNEIFAPNFYLLNMVSACCAFAFINAITLGADAVLTFILRRDF